MNERGTEDHHLEGGYLVTLTPRTFMMSPPDWHAMVLAPDGEEGITTSRWRWLVKRRAYKMVQRHKGGKGWNGHPDTRQVETYRL